MVGFLVEYECTAHDHFVVTPSSDAWREVRNKIFLSNNTRSCVFNDAIQKSIDFFSYELSSIF